MLVTKHLEVARESRPTQKPNRNTRFHGSRYPATLWLEKAIR